MSQINRFGLLCWLMVIVGVIVDLPDNLFKLSVCIILVIVGSVCLLTKYAPDNGGQA